MSSGIKIRVAGPGHFQASCRLLAAAGLPVQDLTRDHFEGFFVAERADEIIGLVGLECFAAIGLMRSLVVATTSRGLGLGHALVNELEVAATARGISELWLLTLDADRFFSRLGYVVIGRDAAPDAIASTAESTDLCPGDAVLMRKLTGPSRASA